MQPQLDTQGIVSRRHLLGAAGVAAVIAATHPDPAAAATSGLPVYNVRDYGAIGDGVTDDAPAIQRAIQDSTSGSTVFFAAGTYAIRSPIRVRGSRAYVGAGHAYARTAVIKQANGANMRGANGVTGLFVADEWAANVNGSGAPLLISNLAFHGNRSANASSQACGLVLMNYWSRVERCHFEQMPLHGIHLTDRTANNTLLNDQASNSENRILDCRFEYMTGHGISQVCDNFISDQDGYCEDNLFSQIGRDMMHFARGSGWLFRRNHGYDIGENGIWLDNCYATVLTENEVEEFGNRNVAGTYYQGIYVRQLNDRGTIVSQNFVSCREPAGSAVFEFVQVLAGTNQGDCHVILTDNLIKGKGSPRSRGIIAQGDAGGVLYLVAAGNRIANVGTESWFSSAVVASRRELGTLSIAGDVTTGAHLVATGAAPAAALLGANGTGAPSPTVSGSDARGTVGLGSGTGAAAGDQVQLRFARAFGAAPSVIVTPRNRATAALRPYVTGESTTAFSIGFDAAPTAGRPAGTYALAYHALG